MIYSTTGCTKSSKFGQLWLFKHTPMGKMIKWIIFHSPKTFYDNAGEIELFKAFLFDFFVAKNGLQ